MHVSSDRKYNKLIKNCPLQFGFTKNVISVFCSFELHKETSRVSGHNDKKGLCVLSNCNSFHVVISNNCCFNTCWTFCFTAGRSILLFFWAIFLHFFYLQPFIYVLSFPRYCFISSFSHFLVIYNLFYV